MDTPIYIDTYFRVESGYDGGRMPEEKAGRFFDEVKRLFTETGFSIKENKYKDGCPEVYLGKTCLYCHPQSLSGPVLKEHMELIEKILAQGTTFRYLRTDTYGEILDLTEEEELAYYHKTHDMTIGGVFLDAFRVESGYDGGRMPEEKAGRFFDEVKRLFTETGFSIKENKYKDGCPEVYLGKTCLYCHPQSLSGPVLKEHMELIEKILAQGTTFRYLRTDTYGEILDLTEEEELAYYHKTHDMTIGGVFLDAFRTKRRNLYKSREQVLEILVEKLRVKTLRGKSVYSNTSPAYRYIREMYGKMVSEGRLVEGCKQTASGKLPLCRTATGRELKMKRREDDRTE